MTGAAPVPYAAVILDDGDQLLLGRQYGGYPCPPGGRIEDGETPAQAAVREVWEETRIVVRPSDLIEVQLITHVGKTNSATHLGWWFAARTWEGQPVNAEPTKCEGWQWHPHDRLPAGMDPHTTDTIAAYLRGTYSLSIGERP